MRRFLATCGIALTLILAGGAFVPQASAQGDQTLIDSGGAAEGAKTSVEGGGAAATDDAAKKTSAGGAEGVSNTALGSVMTWVMTQIMSLFATMLGIAALTLNYAVYYCVVTMGEVVNQLDAIGVTWRILRDIGNIALLFGFIATGVAVVLGVNWYGDRNKLIPKLLIAAVALNFSLFAAEAVIDVGNLFATQFYIQINGGKAPEPFSVSGAYSGLQNEGISNKLMAQLGFASIYGDALKDAGLFKFDGTFFIGMLSIMLFLITSLVFFSLAFILIQRFVVLIALIIVSPIGVAGYAIPQLESTAKKWWSMLFKQTITAPVLLLGLYVALAVITDDLFLKGFGIKGTPSWTGVTGGNLDGFAGLFLSYLVAMGLLLGVALLSKQLGAYGSDRALSWAGKASFGVTAWAGRRTVGWAGNKGADWVRRSPVGRVPILGTSLAKGFDRAAKGSFDLRSTDALKSLPFGGVNAGSAQKGGYKADLKASIEARTKYAADLKGRELNPEEKKKLALAQNALKEEIKKRSRATNPADYDAADAKIKRLETEIEKTEEATDKGAKRAYAKNLLLGFKEDHWFNKRLNTAANRDAAKKIKDEVKKSKDDQTLEALRKALKDADGGGGGAGGGGGGTTTGGGAGGGAAGGGTPPAGGAP